MFISSELFGVGLFVFVYSVILLGLSFFEYQRGFYKDSLIGVLLWFVSIILIVLVFVFVEEDEDGNIIIGNPKQDAEVEEEEEDVESNVTEHILEDGSKILVIEGEDGKQEVIEVPK